MSNNLESEQFGLEDQRAISGLCEPMVEMISGELAEKLESGDYQLIIGEDASGRIPALIFFQVAKRFAQDSGNEPPKLIFLAGSRKYADKKEKQHRTEEELRDKFRKAGYKKEDFKRALIVTEHVDSGHSPRSIIWALQILGVEVDLATLSSSKYPTSKGKKETLGVDNYYTGRDTLSNWRKIWGNERLSGVRKDPQEIYSTKSEKSNTEVMKGSRRLAREVGNMVYGLIKSGRLN